MGEDVHRLNLDNSRTHRSQVPRARAKSQERSYDIGNEQVQAKSKRIWHNARLYRQRDLIAIGHCETDGGIQPRQSCQRGLTLSSKEFIGPAITGPDDL